MDEHVAKTMENLKRHGFEMCIRDRSTEDGSLGSQGFVTDHLQNLAAERVDVIYTCGPKPMLRAAVSYTHLDVYKRQVWKRRYSMQSSNRFILQLIIQRPLNG